MSNEIKKSTKHLRTDKYDPRQHIDFRASHYLNYTILELLNSVSKEMQIKNHLYSYLAMRGLLEDYRDGSWEKEMMSM